MKIKRKETGERKGNGACNHFFKRLVPVYQLMIYPLIGQIWQVISTLSKWVVPATQHLFSLFCSTWHAVLNVCEIISDWGKWKLRKKFSRSYLQRRKMEKRRPKKLLTTWQCLNYKKSSQQLPTCVFATRDSLFCKMFSLLFFFEQVSKIKKKLRWKVGFGTKKNA